MHAAAQTTKPPVPYTDAAIKAGIAHEAANGPSHVRIKALGMMARINGLFEQGKQLARQLTQDANQAAQQATEQISAGYRRATEIMNGAEVTEADLGGFARFFKEADSEQEDEEGSTQDDDEPH